VVANATSTLALVLGTAGSLYGYRPHLPKVQVWLKKFLPISILGGLIGGVLLTYTTDKVFAKLVPFLILFATLLFLSQGIVRRFFVPADSDPNAPPHKHSLLAAMLL